MPVVAVMYDQFTELVVALRHIGSPPTRQILDLGATLEFFIRGLAQRGIIVKPLYDPGQAINAYAEGT